MPTDLSFEGDLRDLDRATWFDKLEQIAEDYGSYLPLGNDHAAVFVDDGSTLVVCFETATSIRKTNPGEEPRGWSFVRDCGWSCLTILAKDDTWFRDPAVYAYFDRLIDDGFFDEFDDILFTGTGAGGYAAAAYSVAAPGCRVLALQPAATLDPAVAGWDTRYKAKRMLSFTDRFGYAPDMIEATEQTIVITDPSNPLDAMHAALFRGPNVLQLNAPRLSARIDRDFDQMHIMEDLMEATMEGALDETVWSRLWRRRQRHLPYLRTTLQVLERSGRYELAARLCRYVVGLTGRPMFQRKLDEYIAEGRIAAPADAPEQLAEPAE